MSVNHPLDALLCGKTLSGKYHIDRLIGRGAMGAVYSATGPTATRVAVKIGVAVAADFETQQHLRIRFQREASVLKALQHPNVIRVYDYGTDPELHLDFLVMEYLDGEDLSERIRREPRPTIYESLITLSQIVRGVAACHERGLVHRDIKPRNIFLNKGDGGFSARLLDFGIVQLPGTEQTLTHLTRFGGAPGTPAYSSPEQLRGVGPLTPASDVFSLGIVGFELLTGERPFQGIDLIRETRRPSLNIGVSDPLIGPPLQLLFERALAMDPADRFPDAAALSKEIDHLIIHEILGPISTYVNGISYDSDYEVLLLYDEYREIVFAMWDHREPLASLELGVTVHGVEMKAGTTAYAESAEILKFMNHLNAVSTHARFSYKDSKVVMEALYPHVWDPVIFPSFLESLLQDRRRALAVLEALPRKGE